MVAAVHHVYIYLLMGVSEECEFLIIWGTERRVIWIQRGWKRVEIITDRGEKQKKLKGKS